MMNNKRGFTLIELLVVIAIMSLLVSIVMIPLNSARTRARVVATIAQASEMNQAIIAYINDVQELPGYDANWGDVCETAMFVSGNFSYKGNRPAKGWNGPYLNAWPKNKWKKTYHWEFIGGNNAIPTLVVDGVSTKEAEMIDKIADDGNLTTGMVRIPREIRKSKGRTIVSNVYGTRKVLGFYFDGYGMRGIRNDAHKAKGCSVKKL